MIPVFAGQRRSTNKTGDKPIHRHALSVGNATHNAQHSLLTVFIYACIAICTSSAISGEGILFGLHRHPTPCRMLLTSYESYDTYSPRCNLARDIRNWITASAITGDLDFNLIDCVPCGYRMWHGFCALVVKIEESFFSAWTYKRYTFRPGQKPTGKTLASMIKLGYNRRA